MKKRILSLLLCIILCLTLMPMSAFAEESFDFNDLPTAGVTNITVSEGDYDTKVAVKDAFILFWNENIKTDGEFVLVDCFDVDVNAYHMWIVSFENDVISAMEGGYSDLDTILYSINDPNPIYDWWINGTYTADTEDTLITSVTISGFENPAIGEAAGSRSNLTLPEGAPYELETYSDNGTIWLCAGIRMKKDDTFVQDQQYYIFAGLKAKEGYYFADTCTYKLLDKSGNEVQLHAGIDYETPYAKTADFSIPRILLEETGPVTVYDIVFDGNGGSGSMSMVTVKKDTEYTIPECGFDPAEGEADFAYWEAAFDSGSSKNFLPGEKWTADDSMRLKAIWSEQGVPGLWLGDTPVRI